MNSLAAARHFTHSHPCLNIGPLDRVSSKEEAKDHFAVLRLGETHVNRQPELEPAARPPTSAPRRDNHHRLRLHWPSTHEAAALSRWVEKNLSSA